MAYPVAITSNNGSTYYNKNICQSYTQTITTSLTSLKPLNTPLSASQPCSEISFIFPAVAATVTLYDNNDTTNPLTIPLNTTAPTQFTFKGVTCTGVVSASASQTMSISYRTAFYTGSVLAQ